MPAQPIAREGSSGGGQYKFSAVSDTDDVRMFEYIKPSCEKTKDEACEGVGGQL